MDPLPGRFGDPGAVEGSSDAGRCKPNRESGRNSCPGTFPTVKLQSCRMKAARSIRDPGPSGDARSQRRPGGGAGCRGTGAALRWSESDRRHPQLRPWRGGEDAVEPLRVGRRRGLRRNDEAHIPAQCPQAARQARFQSSHEDPGRPGCHPGPSAPRPGPPVRLMIEGLSGRRAFERVRAGGVSARWGPIRVRYCPGPGPVCRFGFATPRSAGSAVTRNRSRRRIQAVLRDLDREAGGLPRPGDYCVGIAAPLNGLSASELRAAVVDLLRRVSRSAAR